MKSIKTVNIGGTDFEVKDDVARRETANIVDVINEIGFGISEKIDILRSIIEGSTGNTNDDTDKINVNNVSVDTDNSPSTRCLLVAMGWTSAWGSSGKSYSVVPSNSNFEVEETLYQKVHKICASGYNNIEGTYSIFVSIINCVADDMDIEYAIISSDGKTTMTRQTILLIPLSDDKLIIPDENNG